MLTARSLRRTSLLALFVLLWGLVFPALANADVGHTNSVWAEVCTAQGIKQIQQGSDQTHPLGYHATAEHCALCCLHGSLPEAVAPALVRGLVLQLPVATYSFPQAVVLQPVVLLSAPPRAPPFSIV